MQQINSKKWLKSWDLQFAKVWIGLVKGISVSDCDWLVCHNKEINLYSIRFSFPEGRENFFEILEVSDSENLGTLIIFSCFFVECG